MTSVDKRQVSTDALETLGRIITENEKRDAIHIAVIPVKAIEHVSPGDHVTAKGKKVARYEQAYDDPYEILGVGIVDPFIDRECIYPGEWFWLLLYPRQVNSLRHVWTHPAFPETESHVEESKKWIKDFLKIIDLSDCMFGVDGNYDDDYDHLSPQSISYDYFMKACDEWVGKGEELDFGLNNPELKEDVVKDLWYHYEIVTGKTVPEDKKKDFFGCCC